MVGPFTPRECAPYQKLAEAQFVTGIEFVGYVSPERLPTFYHQADIFCAPSLGCESFGIVLLEAMAAGLPVVASDIPGYRTVLADGQEGRLIPPGQAEGLAEALRQLLNQPQQRQEMGQRGRLKASQYNWDLVVDQVLELYRETIEVKTRVRRKNPGQVEAGLGSPCITSG